ncbi:hypothetical protein [Streptomyces laurentii]|uniref:hypothetical protein n=1 Tax=Streptomyces laurentii TaxID=39478 RepID=UPI00367BDCE3
MDPSNDGPARFWELEDTAVLASWPTPGDPGRVDIVVGTGVREDDFRGGKRLPSGRPEGLSGGTYHLDGQHVTDRPGLLLALGEALLGPGAHLRDMPGLGDGLPVRRALRRSPVTLVWHHADIARQALAEHIPHHLGGLRP